MAVLSLKDGVCVIAGRDRRGFTLMELLVVISIIALLIAILLPVLGSVRTSAQATQALSNKRQTLIAYNNFSLDHKDRLLYGYCPKVVDGEPLKATVNGVTFDGASRNILVGRSLSHYPVRLGGYQGNNDVFEMLFYPREVPDLPQPSDSDSSAGRKGYRLGTNPSFGINAVFVGGSEQHGGFLGGKTGARYVVWKQNQVRRPSELIAFSESKLRGGGLGDGDEVGYHLVSPPSIKGVKQWRPEGDRFKVLNRSELVGLPEGRFGSGAVTGFMDGHVERVKPSDLFDMRLWANDAKGEKDDPSSP